MAGPELTFGHFMLIFPPAFNNRYTRVGWVCADLQVGSHESKIAMYVRKGLKQITFSKGRQF